MKKILIVDDDILKNLLKIMLKPLGLEVILASDGNEGLKQIETHGDDIAIILLDMMMPGMDGLRFLKVLREEKNNSTPVIALSSVNDPEHIEKVLEAGAARYCVKPTKAEVIMAKIKEVLEL